MNIVPRAACKSPCSPTVRSSTSDALGRIRSSRVLASQRYASDSTKAAGGIASAGKAKVARSDERARRALLLDVLSSSATKRDAKTYLSRFSSGSKASADTTQASSDLIRAARGAQARGLRAALIVIRSVSSIDDTVLSGIGHTVSQLSRLGQSCIVIVDDIAKGTRVAPRQLSQQVERVMSCIGADGTVRAERLDKVFYSSGPRDPRAAGVKANKLDRLYTYLARDAVVVMAPFVYGEEHCIAGTNANGVVLSLTRDLCQNSGSGPISLDRLIIIDPHGGIPNVGLGGSHVFVNLQQEFADINDELQGLLHDGITDVRSAASGKRAAVPEVSVQQKRPEVSKAAAVMSRADVRSHLENLTLTRGALARLPATSSALIITPSAAAFDASMPVKGVGTRSARNPLIHNLLTDKPFFSSSLPRRRLSASDTADIPTNHPSMLDAPPTYLKHGVPVIVTPNPLTKPWHPPRDATFSLSLDDPRIDRARLVGLMEDSFGRQLDAEDYFKRIRSRLAGIIVAGDYEGGAILTWERPASFASDATASTPSFPRSTSNRPDRLVPYLDKFAVLRKSQGGGVADVVFSAMVRRCFPGGVCWRSRNGNPVNKWYFERARGALKLPVQGVGEQAWTMFWTTENLQPDRLREYAEVCLAVKGSWADGKKTPD